MDLMIIFGQCYLQISLALGIIVFLGMLLHLYWFSPLLVYRKLKNSAGLTGPPPTFPLGNLTEMSRSSNHKLITPDITHDIHSCVFPYFSRWNYSYGKVFIYWLGTEPFLYVAEPEFLKKVASGSMSKSWGKPSVFKNDRKPMFGNGLLMIEGEDWVRHRQAITPALSPASLKAMVDLMVEPTTKMLDRWRSLVASGKPEIDIEKSLTTTAAEIIARTIFGIDHQNGKQVFDKLRAMQLLLFRSHRMVGVPFSKLMYLKQTIKTRRLGNEIDHLLRSIIASRKARKNGHNSRHDLLGLLMEENHGRKLNTRELVDECKTFFFGGHETTALALTWTLLLLALNPEWQSYLREEIKEVIGDDQPLDYNLLLRLNKMNWVMNEAIRLYSPAPNIQRQAREDIRVGEMSIPKGTNMWIDVVSMHHDPDLWGKDVNEFKPERFKDDLHGGCKHRMGFLPFGFGGRMCIGRNVSMMEYKIVLTLILTKFSFSLSPNYCHSPTSLLSLRPSNGLLLILQPL